MKRDFEDIFLVNNPSYPNIDEGILLFQKIIYSNIIQFELGGLHRILPIALNEAYTSKIGQIGPLRVIADCMEPYLKKICLIAGLDSVNATLTKELMPLLKMLNLNTALTNQSRGGYPQFTEINLSSYHGSQEYLEFICDAYLTRNKVHTSPDWNRKQVINKLTNLLVVYVYAALKYKLEIERLQDVQPTSTFIKEKINSDQKYLYYFISFGSTTNKIRNQIVTSYILNYLKENQPIKIEQIQMAANSFFANEMNINYYQNLIQKLERESKIELNKQQKLIQLLPAEYKRICDVQNNFEENRSIFFLFLEDISKKYNIHHLLSDLFDKLLEFIENNYNIDMAEAYNKGVDIEKDENQTYQSFINYLQSITENKDQANTLFKDLIELSRDSDFLIRMCASKAFATLSNPDRFEQYMHQETRVVYLDTQIILFALCLNYVPKASYDNFYYQTTEELIELANKNKNIQLKVSRLYLQEVAYQLKLALLLIPFEEMGKGKLSSNVFYQFYWHLKEKGMLDEEDKSFADFMYTWFKLYEEDAYDSKFFSIAYSNLYDFLTGSDLNIEVVTIPTYDNKYDAVEILNQVLASDNFKFRPKHSVDNDAIMMCHLCNGDIHVVEPFFLTWDKAFTNFRKEFIRKYKRNSALSFHLFNPARFINHYSLLKLKINPQAITNDFLSIMDSNNIHEKTQTVWDAINRFLNIDNINSQKRKIYIGKVKDLFEQELDYTSEDASDFEKTNKVLLPFEEVIGKINDYYTNNSNYNIGDYRNLLLTENYFDKAAKLIFQNVSEPDTNINVFVELDNLISELKKTL
ncbi:MAG TPA: hypothetical protein PLP23_11965 [Panacibacter sp.]|nr:hypothetical protein [Panacibacter sp.]